MLVGVGQVGRDGKWGTAWWGRPWSAAAMVRQAVPVGLFVWGLTEDDARLAEFQAHDEAAWRGWSVRQTTRVIGGRMSDARGALPGPLLAKRATYGRVVEVYELSTAAVGRADVTSAAPAGRPGPDLPR